MNVLSSPYNSVSGQLYGGWKPPKKRLSATARALIPYRLANLLKRNINTPAMKWNQKKFDKLLGKAPAADRSYLLDFLPSPASVKNMSEALRAAKWRAFEGLPYPRAYMKSRRKGPPTATPGSANTVAQAATAVATMAKAVAETAKKSAKKKGKKS